MEEEEDVVASVGSWSQLEGSENDLNNWTMQETVSGLTFLFCKLKLQGKKSLKEKLTLAQKSAECR